MDVLARIPVPPSETPWRASPERVNVTVDVQGSVVVCRVVRGPADRPAPCRGKVWGFSRASRLAMLRMVSRIDFDKVGRSTFMTLTFPDEVGKPDAASITEARDAFQKAWERYAGASRPGLWRVEWEQRLTGKYRGRYMPHIHYLWMGCPFWAQADVQDTWQRIIKTRIAPRVDVREATGKRRVGYYVSKYIGKPSPSGSLVIDAYLAAIQPGRKWGVLRKSLIPWCKRTQAVIDHGEDWDMIRSSAKDSWDGVSNDGEHGFTLFGEGAENIRKYLETKGA